MKHVLFVLAACLCAIFIVSFASQAAEKAPTKVLDLANGELAALGRDPVIVAAVKDKNARGETLDQVKALDQTWRDTPGLADFMLPLMKNPCALHIKELQEKSPYFLEIFIMDHQGAIVAMTEKTSDYWQGDEAKFQNSHKEGRGEVFVDDIKFDDSAQSYLVQVSVPVMDQDRAIGAITFGIDVDKL
ncbi:MAG: PDC sensor domain-containing protein [Pseudomonadota bacterium]